jgi:hypothetical protein
LTRDAKNGVTPLVRADHANAENLFERLSRFYPRQGEQRKREPLEDFTTEAIAYFLSTSPEFRTKFYEKVLGIPKPKTSPSIHTQHRQENFKGIADLVLEGEDIIGIEVKRSAEFQEDQPNKPHQLQRMQDGFEIAYLLAPRLYIAINDEIISQHTVKMAYLEDVCSICAGEPLLEQFGEFLRSKGHGHITLTMTPSKINSIADSAIQLSQWAKFLLDLKKLLEIEKPGPWQDPQWDNPNNNFPNSSFYGMTGPDGSYAGFEISHTDNKVTIYYEERRREGEFDAAVKNRCGFDGKEFYYHAETKTYPETTNPNDLSDIFLNLQTQTQELFSGKVTAQE